MERRYRVGCSGWAYPHWKGVLYPPELRQSQWFEEYAREFETVEINNSFYRLPKEQTWRNWASQAPDGFVYAVKASRYVTHVVRLRDVAEPIENVCRPARLLGEHLGPMLWQLPPSMKADLGLLREFLSLLPEDIRHVMEFREESWFDDEVFEALRVANVAFCVWHRGEEETPLEVTTDLAYLRFHGTESRYGGEYSEQELRSWCRRLVGLPADVREVWAYFNNDAFGCAVRNAKTLRALLG